MWKKLKYTFTAAPMKPGYADAGDLLRVLCTFFVAWFHIWQQSWLSPNFEVFGEYVRLWPVVACGYIFVDLLLLLSGFLLMLGFLSGRNRRIGPFYAGRLTRILPSYLLCVLVLFFAFALPNGLYRNAAHARTDILSHLTFTHTFFYDAYYASKINGALWTLCIEMQFYLVFPLLGRAFEKKPALTYALMMAAGIFFRAGVYLWAGVYDMYFNQLPAFLDVYANGMLAALIFHRLSSKKVPPQVQKKKPRRRTSQPAWSAWLCTALAVLSIAAMYKVADLQYSFSVSGRDQATRLGQMVYRLPLTLAGCVFLVCGSRAIGLFRWLCSNKLVRWFSSVSFNFYMWHQVLAVKLKEWRIPPYTGTAPHKESQQPWQWQYTLTCFFGALLLSVLVTYLIEKPVSNFIRRRMKRTPKKLETPAA